MGQIRVLTDRVANQIAAGEVVERPASVCKELIENALDAGAKRLRIDLVGGGRNLIEVSDNGCGMSRDDAMLAFERHATSKLRSVQDLAAIATLGFRGEALPSIASVARVELRTRLADEKEGTRVEIHGGRMRDVSPIAFAEGTTVSVRNLFYNVPARRKFLRAERTELSHAVRAATHYSLAHLDKSIELRAGQSVPLSVSPVGSRRERVYQVFGGELLDRLVELSPVQSDGGGPDLGLEGFVAEPQAHRPTRNAFYVFVNGRLVRDSLVNRAVAAAYENLMPKGVYPFVLLFLRIDPQAVDVNVHPAKTEVRFRAPGAVFEFLRGSIRSQLVAAKPAAPLPAPGPAGQWAAPPGAGWQGQRATVPTGTQEAPPPPVPGRLNFPPPERPAGPPPTAVALGAGDEVGRTNGADARHSREPLDEREPTSLLDLRGLRLLGQIHDSFIVAAGADGLWLIDQHVAHERILFEKLLADRLHGRARRQMLLTPLVLTLTPGQAVAFDELAEEFRACGFDIDRYDGRSIAVQAVPAELSGVQIQELVTELLDDTIESTNGQGLAALRKRMAATMACHSAIKVNMPLAMDKMRWLLDELARSDCPMSCPHGRPIALQYGTRDILKAFHRI